MAFTVASWNVEHFGQRRPGEAPQSVSDRIDRVFTYLREKIDADVYAIYEVNGGTVYDKVKSEFPEYSWSITEGSGSQLILVGHRIPVFITYRAEFSRGFTGPLRPGVLAAVRDGGADFPILFLHLKAAGLPIDFGVRAYQHDKARSLRKALDGADAAGHANFIITGDLNNVGLELSYSGADITETHEVARLRAMYGSRWDSMSLRPKSHQATFWNGPGSSDPPADLDHVIAANHVQLATDANGAQVQVLGWPEETTDNDMATWIADFSDHALLKFTVTGTNSP
jgi:hypothetical protein